MVENKGEPRGVDLGPSQEVSRNDDVLALRELLSADGVTVRDLLDYAGDRSDNAIKKLRKLHEKLTRKRSGPEEDSKLQKLEIIRSVLDTFKENPIEQNRIMAELLGSAPEPIKDNPAKVKETKIAAETKLDLDNKKEKESRLEFRVQEKSIASEKHPDRNEDSVLSNKEREVFGVFDGIGAKAGNASEVARDYFNANAAQFEGLSIEEAKKKMMEMMMGANDAILQEAGKKPELKGMGTTTTVAKFLKGGKMVIGHAGDCRVYIVRGGKRLEQITEDDNLVKESVLDGTIAPAKARTINEEHSNFEDVNNLSNDAKKLYDKYTVYQSLGNNHLRPSVYVTDVGGGDTVLITSDGIHDNLTEKEILESFNKEGNHADNLVAGAKERSLNKSHSRHKSDDMSAVVIEAIMKKPEVSPVTDPLKPEALGKKLEGVLNLDEIKDLIEILRQEIGGNLERINGKKVSKILFSILKDEDGMVRKLSGDSPLAVRLKNVKGILNIVYPEGKEMTNEQIDAEFDKIIQDAKANNIIEVPQSQKSEKPKKSEDGGAPNIQKPAAKPDSELGHVGKYTNIPTTSPEVVAKADAQIADAKKTIAEEAKRKARNVAETRTDVQATQETQRELIIDRERMAEDLKKEKEEEQKQKEVEIERLKNQITEPAAVPAEDVKVVDAQEKRQLKAGKKRRASETYKEAEEEYEEFVGGSEALGERIEHLKEEVEEIKESKEEAKQKRDREGAVVLASHQRALEKKISKLNRRWWVSKSVEVIDRIPLVKRVRKGIASLWNWAMGASERATDVMDNLRGVTGKRYEVKEKEEAEVPVAEKPAAPAQEKEMPLSERLAKMMERNPSEALENASEKEQITIRQEALADCRGVVNYFIDTRPGANPDDLAKILNNVLKKFDREYEFDDKQKEIIAAHIERYKDEKKKAGEIFAQYKIGENGSDVIGLLGIIDKKHVYTESDAKKVTISMGGRGLVIETSDNDLTRSLTGKKPSSKPTGGKGFVQGFNWILINTNKDIRTGSEDKDVALTVEHETAHAQFGKRDEAKKIEAKNLAEKYNSNEVLKTAENATQYFNAEKDRALIRVGDEIMAMTAGSRTVRYLRLRVKAFFKAGHSYDFLEGARTSEIAKKHQELADEILQEEYRSAVALAAGSIYNLIEYYQKQQWTEREAMYKAIMTLSNECQSASDWPAFVEGFLEARTGKKGMTAKKKATEKTEPENEPGVESESKPVEKVAEGGDEKMLKVGKLSDQIEIPNNIKERFKRLGYDVDQALVSEDEDLYAKEGAMLIEIGGGGMPIEEIDVIGGITESEVIERLKARLDNLEFDRDWAGAQKGGAGEPADEKEEIEVEPWVGSFEDVCMVLNMDENSSVKDVAAELFDQWNEPKNGEREEELQRIVDSLEGTEQLVMGGEDLEEGLEKLKNKRQPATKPENDLEKKASEEAERALEKEIEGAKNFKQLQEVLERYVYNNDAEKVAERIKALRGKVTRAGNDILYLDNVLRGNFFLIEEGFANEEAARQLRRLKEACGERIMQEIKNRGYEIKHSGAPLYESSIDDALKEKAAQDAEFWKFVEDTIKESLGE